MMWAVFIREPDARGWILHLFGRVRIKVDYQPYLLAGPRVIPYQGRKLIAWRLSHCNVWLTIDVNFKRLKWHYSRFLWRRWGNSWGRVLAKPVYEPTKDLSTTSA